MINNPNKDSLTNLNTQQLLQGKINNTADQGKTKPLQVQQMKPQDFYFIKSGSNAKNEDYETSSIETNKSGTMKKKIKIVSMSLPNNT